MTGPQAAPQTVYAAGALCWRTHQDALQVLMVHRPKYDDWSWPKGKLALREAAPVGCIREIGEETGLRIRLGLPLPPMTYTLSDNRPKHVSMWAAHVADMELPATLPRPHEVDRAEWVAAADVANQLTRRTERQQFKALTAHAEAGTLLTWPLVIVRSGHAYPRRSWRGDEADRPLVEAGHRQARDLVDLLATWGPDRVWCAKWDRCVETVRPFCDRVGVPLKAKNRLTERQHSADPRRVERFVDKLIDAGRPVAVCTQGSVVSAILQYLMSRTDNDPDQPVQLPAAVEPGEIVVAHVGKLSGRVISVERHVASSTQYGW